MAPVKVKSGAAKGANKRSTKPSSSGSSSKNKKASAGISKPAPKEVKSKPLAKDANKKKKKVYTDEELGIPKLNMITPAGVQKQKGKKKGKVFVDDQESMMTILAMVNADKEGQIESKMLRARQMEEIRQARTKEMEARADEKKKTLEDKKTSLKRKRKSKSEGPVEDADASPAKTNAGKPKKRVSFG